MTADPGCSFYNKRIKFNNKHRNNKNYYNKFIQWKKKIVL